MAKEDKPSIAVLGGGPIGIEAALYARQLGLPVTVYERGRLAEHVQRWGHVRLFSPFGLNSTSLGRQVLRAEKPMHAIPPDGECLTGRQHLEAYLYPLADTDRLRDCFRQQQNVLHVGRSTLLKTDLPGDPKRAAHPFRLLVRDAENRERIERADVVLDCTGTYGQHRWLGDGGIPAPGELSLGQQIVYTLEDFAGEHQARFAGKKILLLGSGYSAATAVCALADLAEKHQDTWVVWIARTSRTQPLPRIQGDSLKERDRLAARANNLATRTDGNVEFHNQTVVDAIESLGDHGLRVHCRRQGKAVAYEVERVIAQVGYSPDSTLYRELQIHECYASQGPMKMAASLAKHSSADCLAIPSQEPDTLKSPEPGFFILGSKSYGRSSSFLLKVGFEQIRDVFRLITGQPRLDLYKQPLL